MPNEKPVGQSKLTYSGALNTAALDKNWRTRYTDAVGTISDVGKWREMEQTSVMVSLGSRALLGVLQGVNWDFQHHEDTPEQIVEYLRSAFFERMDRPWESVAESIFAAVRYGFAPHEITLFTEGNLVYLRDLGYRPPWTIDLYTVRKGDKGWMECTQRYYRPDNMGIEMAFFGQPGEAGKGWLLWPTFGDNGGPLGEAFYRPIFAIYEEWADALRRRRIAVQKTVGVPIAFVRENAKPTEDDQEDTREELGSLTTHEKGSGTMPAWVERIEWSHPEPESIRALTEVLGDCDARIALAFGAQYAIRGLLTKYGTQSAGETDSAQLSGHRQYFLDWLSRQVQPIVDWLVDENFGPQKYYPQLTASAPEELEPAVLVDSIVKASAGGALIIDSGIRDNVRNSLKLEPEGAEAQAALAEKEERAAALQGALQKSNTEPENDKDEDDDETPEMTGCHCNLLEFQGEGLRAPPKPGGQQRRTGPNGRDLSKLERLVRWNSIEMTLDSSKASMKQMLMDAREQVAREMLKHADAQQWETSAELAKVLQKYKAPAALKKRIKRSIDAQLQHVVNVAQDTVDSEREQQTGTEFAIQPTADSFSDVYTDEATEESIADTRVQLVRAALSITAPTRSEIMSLLREATAELSASQADATATLATTEVFARARAERAQEIVDRTGRQPDAVYYSAILDANTCDPCFLADQQFGQLTGEPIQFDSATMAEYMPPYQRCEGGVRCRCQLIFDWGGA